jgi:hypothetical protein
MVEKLEKFAYLTVNCVTRLMGDENSVIVLHVVKLKNVNPDDNEAKVNMTFEIKIGLHEVSGLLKSEIGRQYGIFILFILNNRDKILSAVLCDGRVVAFRPSP